MTEQLTEIAQAVLQYALAVLVPVVITFAAAWLRAQTAKLRAETQSVAADVGLALAEAAVIAVEAEADAQWNGQTKKRIAEERLRAQGAAFAIPYLEQAVAYCQERLNAIAAKRNAKVAEEAE